MKQASYLNQIIVNQVLWNLTQEVIKFKLTKNSERMLAKN